MLHRHPLFRVTKVIIAANTTVYAQWKAEKILVYNGQIENVSTTSLWTNNTGKTAYIDYSIRWVNSSYLCDFSETATYIRIGIGNNYTVKAGYKESKSGTLVVPAGSTIMYNEYYAYGYVTLYYYQ